MTSFSAALGLITTLVLASCRLHRSAPNQPSYKDATASASQLPVTSPRPKRPDSSAPSVGRSVQEISLEASFQYQQSGNAIFLDARPAFLYRLGHLPGAVNVPLSRADEFLDQHQPNLAALQASQIQLVVYCTGIECPDAGLLANRLVTSGHSVAVFAGGWRAWREAELPVSHEVVDFSRVVTSLTSNQTPTTSSIHP